MPSVEMRLRASSSVSRDTLAPLTWRGGMVTVDFSTMGWVEDGAERKSKSLGFLYLTPATCEVHRMQA